jgi:hypothetical protein
MLPPLDMPELQKHLIDCVGAVINESLGEDYLLRLGASIMRIHRQPGLVLVRAVDQRAESGTAGFYRRSFD